MLAAYALVGLAGAAGAVLRLALSRALLAWAGAWLPWGTLAANVIGSFALGAAVQLPALAEARWLGVDARLVLGAGLLGGFTTYASFNLETLRLVEQGAYGRAAGYALGTFVLCALAGLAGLRAGGR